MPYNSIITIKTFSATSLTKSAARSNSHDAIDPMRPNNLKTKHLFSLINRLFYS